MNILKRVPLKIAGATVSSRAGQSALGGFIKIAQYLMGIGAGSSPQSSGETTVLRLVKTRLHPAERPFCAFDVGANKGQFLSVLLSEFTGTDFVVHAFEPGMEAFRTLSEKFSAAAPIRLNNLALSDKPGNLTLYADAAGSGMSSLLHRDGRHLGVDFSHVQTIAATTLDAYVAQNGVKVIDFLKLDVEGAELTVLQGAETTFYERRVRSVMFEFGGANIDSRTYFRDFYYLFSSYGGARIYRVTPSGFLNPILRYSEALEQFTTTNIFVLLDPAVKM